MDLYWGGPERRITSLTLRIMGINAAALLMLLIGMVYLGQYQNSLIESRLQTFRREAELVAGALAEQYNQKDELDSSDILYKMIWRFSKTMDERIFFFDSEQKLSVDSQELSGYGEVERVRDPPVQPFFSIRVLKSLAGSVLKILPSGRVLPPFPMPQSEAAADYLGVHDAFRGKMSISAWEYNDEVLLAATMPLMKDKRVLGAVMLIREGNDITEEIGDVWLNILTAFTLTLIVTSLLSIYLSGTIARPLRRLAKAAEAMRRGKSRDTEIPDLSDRKDEIGELSIVLREMMQALWDRMDSIEHFAADVAHELKNPLTSLRSAVETLAVVKKDRDREKLLEIIKDDVERMDRLITDISNASRLDSELSRETLESVNLNEILETLVESHRNQLLHKSRAHGTPDIPVIMNLPPAKDLHVWGLRGRVFQVLDNLVSNALSFSPKGGKVTITVTQTRKTTTITVDDEGPGVPENKLETIFERFYTERPEHEAYGKHSGLGLSICRQIVNALGGRIFAENIKGRAQEVTGARFTVILSTA